MQIEVSLPAGAVLRWVRAALLGVVVVATGGIAHASSGGLLPGPVALVALQGAIICGCAALLGREASALRLLTILVAGQGLVHVFLAAAAGHRGDPSPLMTSGAQAAPVTPWDPRSGESYAQWSSHLVGDGHAAEPAVPGWVAHLVSDVSARPVMALAHVLAAVVVGLWLALGERALWTLVRLAANRVAAAASWVAARLSALPVAGISRCRLRQPLSSYLDPRPKRTVWACGPVTRGPPVLALLVEPAAP